MRAEYRRRLARVLLTVVLLSVGLASCQTEPTHGTLVGEEQVAASPQPSPTATTTSPLPEVQPSEPPATIAPVPALVVSMAEPIHLSVPRIGIDAAISGYTNEMVIKTKGTVEPPTLDSVSWWSGGGTPGTDATDTVYLYGHTWINPAVFNRIKELIPGDEIFVTTGNGVLRYVVDDQSYLFQVPKPQFPTDPRVTESVAGRLLLIGCWRVTGKEKTTTSNVVVVAHLSMR